MQAASRSTGPQAVDAGSTRYVRFIILTYARTGSTMLASALNSSPDTICFRELFNPVMKGIGFYAAGYDNNSVEDLALRNEDFRKFLRERVFCRHPSGIHAVGFKMPHPHFQWFPGLLEWLVDDKELRVLHLRRRNLLRLFVSLRIAQQTGGWSEDRGATLRRKFRRSNWLPAARHPLRSVNRLRRFVWPREPAWKARRGPQTLSEEECRAFFEEVERDTAHFAELFGEHPLLTLYYEDLIRDRRRSLNRVQSFLGLESRTLGTTTRRQNPEPLRKLVANYDELDRAFKNSPEAAFFE